ncbi:MAG: transcriptional regulator [Erysipelotrichia bacterium]|nr:transcriptional regulator [Erysipelotrichia bacterium]NCC55331.1 transcriptional regulator [Erysipelotrichia bacterium]
MHPILKQYIPIANMLVQTFGEECEVVLHDLRTPTQSVVYVANNKVTKREVGQSFQHLVPQVILSDTLKDDVVSNYYFTTDDGKLIRSSSVLIRDENEIIIGAMCINLDTSRVTQNIVWLESMLPNRTLPTQQEELVEKPEHITDIVTSLIDNIIKDIKVSELKREDRIELIRFMESKGIFMMKGAIEQVAEKMNITKVTVYSYLDEIKGKNR